MGVRAVLGRRAGGWMRISGDLNRWKAVERRQGSDEGLDHARTVRLALTSYNYYSNASAAAQGNS
jgi:hypothetical protein